MNLLALDTSTEYCSVALRREETLIWRGELLGRGHAERLLPMVESVLLESALSPADLDGIAFGRGPGAFTGLRIAAGVAQGLAFAAGCRVAAISSLAAVAWQVPASPGECVLVCNDARMHEVYWAVYRVAAPGLLECRAPERVSAPEALDAASLAGVVHVAGNALEHVPGLRARLATAGLRMHDGLWPRADAVAALGLAEFVAGRAVPAAAAQPIYVRDEVVGRRVTPLS